MRSIVTAGLALTTVLAGAAVALPALAAPAAPAANPTATLTAGQARINVGGTERFGYTGTSLPSGAVAYLQRLSGHTWKVSEVIGARTHGTVGLKLTSTGAASFRVQFDVGSHAVASSKAVTVTVLPAPAASLKGVTTRVSTGGAATFRYTAMNVASGATVQLQRQFGTAGTWRSVKTLPAATGGTVTGPALPVLGRYVYRLAIVAAGKTVKASAGVAVLAFGNVRLSPICGPGQCAGTETVGNHLWTFTDQVSASYYPDLFPSPVYKNGTSCRSLTVQFAGDNWAQEDHTPQTDYLEFVQQSSDPVYASVTSGNVGTVKVGLDGGPLFIAGAVTNDGGIHNNSVDLNIIGSCYTPSGSK